MPRWFFLCLLPLLISMFLSSDKTAILQFIHFLLQLISVAGDQFLPRPKKCKSLTVSGMPRWRTPPLVLWKHCWAAWRQWARHAGALLLSHSSGISTKCEGEWGEGDESHASGFPHVPGNSPWWCFWNLSTFTSWFCSPSCLPRAAEHMSNIVFLAWNLEAAFPHPLFPCDAPALWHNWFPLLFQQLSALLSIPPTRVEFRGDQ